MAAGREEGLPMFRRSLIVFLLLVLAGLAGQTAGQVAVPNRIGIRTLDGRAGFFDTVTGERFTPRGVYLDHIPGIGRYDLKPMSLDRSMQDVFSAHVGGELDLLDRRLTLRAGYRFESSAVPDATLTVLTPDGDKHLVSLGASVRFAKVRLDVAYGHWFQPDRTVTASRSLQLNPIQPSLAVPVGNGTYRVSTDVLSVGIEARF